MKKPAEGKDGYRDPTGASNSSAPGPDGISYNFITALKDTVFGDLDNLLEVVNNLMVGTIPREWQNSTVVMIPTPGQDHSGTKWWRPINLINCIGKLGEKVMANHWQLAGLSHRHQFGAANGRSATQAVLRAVTRAQRYMAGEDSVGWAF